MKTIQLLGRMATLLLVAIIFEGIMTMGQAFDFVGYSAMGIIFQALIFVVCIWGAAEWHNSENSKS